MSAPVRVTIPDGGRAAELARTVLSSLPLSYAPNGKHEPGAMIIVDGQKTAWPDATATAIMESAAGVVVIGPQPAELGPLLSLLDQHRVPVVVDSSWTNPVIPVAANAFATAMTSGIRLECRMIALPGQDQQAALVDQLFLVRHLIGAASDVRLIFTSDRGYFAEAAVGPSTSSGRTLTVDLSVICTRARPRSATVRLLTLDGSVELFLPSGDTAQPARLITVDQNGATVAPALYESGHRSSWRRLWELINSGEKTTDLQDLAVDIATTHHIRPALDGNKEEHTT